MRFWDSSAIVPLLIGESSSDHLLSLYRSDTVVLAWWGSSIECASAISRLEREGDIEPAAATQAFKRLQEFRDGWQEIQPIEFLRKQALRLLRVHPLKAADALQLAAAITATRNHSIPLDFVCLDTRLATAAEREGFQVIGP